MTKLTLTVESNLLLGTGEGIGIVDTDIVFDQNGFPYFPGRRLKGLLRESALEVCEITETDSVIVDSLFGNGHKSSLVVIPDLIIESRPTIYQSIDKYDILESDIQLTKQEIAAFFTKQIQQTTIDENGVAQDGSLRVYRVLKPGFTFAGEINLMISTETARAESLFQLAVINLKYAGLRRNRGFGEIALQLDDTKSITENINRLTKQNENPTDSSKKDQSDSDDSCGDGSQTKASETYELNANISYRITLNSPVIIAKQQGEQNTVATEDYIPGTAVRGMLASLIIREKKLKNAECDPLFQELFLSGKTNIKGAFINGAIPIPSCLKLLKSEIVVKNDTKNPEDKAKPEKLYNLFDDDKLGITKPKSGWCTFSSNDGENVRNKLTAHQVQKQVSFHSSRKDSRIAGSNKDGAIFYYESFSAGQVFHGEITGDMRILEQFHTLVGAEFKSTIGRSRSAQFGQITVRLDAPSELQKNYQTSESEERKKYQMLLLSPMILSDPETGLSSPNLKTLAEQYLGVKGAVIEKHVINLTTIENHVGVWCAKSPAEQALALGSIIELQISSAEAAQLEKEGVGERTHEGFGQVVFLNLDANYELLKKASENEKPKLKAEGLIKDIILHYKLEEEKEHARKKAQELANKIDIELNGHQLSRVLNIIRNADDSKSDWKNLLVDDSREDEEEKKRKPFTEALEKAKWKDALINKLSIDLFKLDDVKNSDWDFAIRKLFWVTYVTALKKNVAKKRKEQNEH